MLTIWLKSNSDNSETVKQSESKCKKSSVSRYRSSPPGVPCIVDIQFEVTESDLNAVCSFTLM